MSTTPSLGLTHIHVNQGQKEVTANQFADGLDTAIAGSIMIDLSEKVEYTLTATEARHEVTWDDLVRFDNNLLHRTLMATPHKHHKITWVYNDDETQHYDVIAWHGEF